MEKTFGEFLSQKRKENNLTQKELANKLFVTESAVSKWEKDRAKPDITLLPQLSQILNVSEHELITASVDEKQIQTKQYARKWQNLATTWEWFFYISYGIALLTCFIVDLATSGSLTWFFIVLCAILLAASFTTLPKFIKKYRLLFIPLTELGLLFILLGVCCLFTKGDWFFITSISILLGYVIIFLPIIISKYNFPVLVKKLNGLISVVVDYVLLLVSLLIINNYTNGSWFVSFALPIVSICLMVPLAMVAVATFCKFNKALKTSIIIFVWTIFLVILYPLLKTMINQFEGATMPELTSPNFLDWSTNMINNNVIWLMGITLLGLALTFGIIGIVKLIKNKQK